jgi:hypothetical protein
VAVAEASLWLLIADPELSPRAGQESAGRRFAAWCSAGIGGGRCRVVRADGTRAKVRSVRLGARVSLVFSARDGLTWFSAIRRGWRSRAVPRNCSSVRCGSYARTYAAWRGYPTLHGLFLERATQIACSGVIALVVPSPIADLDGYRAVRRVVTSPSPAEGAAARIRSGCVRGRNPAVFRAGARSGSGRARCGRFRMCAAFSRSFTLRSKRCVRMVAGTTGRSSSGSCRLKVGSGRRGGEGPSASRLDSNQGPGG